MAQRLGALDRHAMVNIVNEKHQLSEVNDLFLERTGYTRDELVGEQVLKIYDATNRSVALQIRTALQRGELWQGETPLRRKDGSVIYTHSTIVPLFDAKGAWKGSISVRTDISRTRQLLAERDVAESLHELRDDIWIVHAESEKFAYVNAAARRRLGWKNEEIEQHALGEFSQDPGGKAIRAACRRLVERHETSVQFEETLLGVPFHISIKFVQNDHEKARFLIVLNDISARLEQERRQGEFISTVSHELRSPLTSIKGAMGLMLSNATGDLPGKAISLLEIAHRNADRLVLILNDILDLEKISAGKLEFTLDDVDLSDLVRETQQANATIGQRFAIKMEIEGADAPMPVTTDPNRVMQVLNNLVSNACKFSKAGDTVAIRIRDEGEHIRISVRDQGQGIPLEDQHKIFEKFADLANSSRATKGGTGLGLSICKAIVQNLGGTIGFNSQEGVGTTFYFVLPKQHPIKAETSNEPKLRVAS
ncbi:ATP-binding protein [Pseudosulfitobacter sp. DSM 107133]|uniref:PAS domain-containing sensor histidine kinase n=1 Tax=Pseudosulfitobacter sp. DSM 107133 TaxID=2883100 RepID=UPI001F0738DF|nr:ATP-binding protein [Pseudosulfitobacter sp. DSM 107133]